MTQRFVVPEDIDGMRADRAVSMLCEVSRRIARAAIEAGCVVREKVALPGSARVSEGDILYVDLVTDEPSVEPEGTVRFEVAFEDDDVIVVDKPAGVVVHPGAGRSSGTLANGLLARYPEIAALGPRHRWGIVHRIDQGTSGLLIVARRSAAFDFLQSALKEREVKREYRTLVSGCLASATGTIDAPIGRDPTDATRMAIVASGRPARTHYRRLAEWEGPTVSYVDVSLETGRTHQIRVHMRSIGHPVVGDPVYGPHGAVAGDPGRTWLHAVSLTFEHPSGSGPMTVHSSLPDDLAGSLKSLGEPSRGGVS